jgi:hypothetical protein
MIKKTIIRNGKTECLSVVASVCISEPVPVEIPLFRHMKRSTGSRQSAPPDEIPPLNSPVRTVRGLLPIQARLHR